MFLTYSGVGGIQGLPPTRMRTNYKKSSRVMGSDRELGRAENGRRDRGGAVGEYRII